LTVIGKGKMYSKTKMFVISNKVLSNNKPGLEYPVDSVSCNGLVMLNIFNVWFYIIGLL